MSDPAAPTHAFTKLVVRDLEPMAAFYRRVFGLSEIARVRAKIGDDPIDEIMLGGPGGAVTLVLLCFVEKPPPPRGEVILGFTTGDLDALVARVSAAGGAIHADVREMPEHHVRVAFATDPEGHLAELVQVIA